MTVASRNPIKRTPSGPHQCMRPLKRGVRLIGVCNSEHSRRQCQTNLGTVVIKGKHDNGGAGYGVELPSEFKFQGNRFILQIA
jgi:hypothetical protein